MCVQTDTVIHGHKDLKNHIHLFNLTSKKALHQPYIRKFSKD